LYPWKCETNIMSSFSPLPRRYEFFLLSKKIYIYIYFYRHELIYIILDFKGSKNVNRYYISGIILFGAFIIFILLAVNKRADHAKTVKYRKLLSEQKMKHEMSLDPVKRTFDIEFENIGLVLPTGVSIMEVRNYGYF
jgi:hypothetical protein